MSPFTDHAGLGDDQRAALVASIARLRTLEDVIRWGLALPGSPTITAVIVQDEFTHDVVLPWRDGFHLVFDTT